jgi:hypothetical protein
LIGYTVCYLKYRFAVLIKKNLFCNFLKILYFFLGQKEREDRGNKEKGKIEKMGRTRRKERKR